MRPQEDYPLRRAIRETIEARGVCQTELARKAGITQSQLSRYLALRRDMLAGAADRIRKALGLIIVRPEEEEET